MFYELGFDVKEAYENIKDDALASLNSTSANVATLLAGEPVHGNP